jgi:hypothetical protein
VSISNPWNKIGVVYIGPLIPPKRWQILKLIKTILLAFMASFFSFGKSNAQTSKVFKEPLNTAVFTTQYVIEENKGITYVTHDADDGAWQFFSDDKFEDFEKVAKVVVDLQQNTGHSIKLTNIYFAVRLPRAPQIVGAILFQNHPNNFEVTIFMPPFSVWHSGTAPVKGSPGTNVS